jgi:hypothetical protein
MNATGEETKEERAVKAIGYVTTGIVVTVLGYTWAGYVLSVLWSWFMVTAFGLPHLSIPATIGIATIVTYLTHQNHTDRNDKRPALDKTIEAALGIALKPALALFVGWVVRLFL